MCRIDADNTAWLKQVIAEHGWPGVALVGEQGAEEVWLLAQHADLAPGFQRQALELLETAVAAGEPQVYGTHYTHDPDGSPAPAARCRP
jgi:hypothetical protein